MNEYDIYDEKRGSEFNINVSCIDMFENIPFMHKSENILVATSYSTYFASRKRSYMTISYIFQGTVGYIINGKKYVGKAGEFIIIGRGCTATHFVEDGGGVFYSAIFNHTFCEKNNITDDIVCHVSVDGNLSKKFIDLIRAYDNAADPSFSKEPCLKMLKYVDKKYKQYSVGYDDSKTFSDRQMRKVLNYIKHNLDNSIRVSDLAKILGYNVDYFTRIFKKTCGYTPIAYVNFVRCRTARQMLLMTD
ncbi:MAG: helix-turn-helix transcriptional regulator, partial [Clostridia bacterium]|nr:helix-turn-helix transcriptional regulator [Clostridia bacterium]